MNQDRATRIDRLTQEASQLLDDSVRTALETCSEKAAGVYRSSIAQVMGDMAAGLLFPLWREHPDLEPKGFREPGAYDPRDFKMSPQAAQHSLVTLSKARALMRQVGALLASEPDAAQRQAYEKELETVFRAIDAAARGVERRRDSA